MNVICSDWIWKSSVTSAINVAEVIISSYLDEVDVHCSRKCRAAFLHSVPDTICTYILPHVVRWHIKYVWGVGACWDKMIIKLQWAKLFPTFTHQSWSVTYRTICSQRCGTHTPHSSHSSECTTVTQSCNLLRHERTWWEGKQVNGSCHRQTKPGRFSFLLSNNVSSGAFVVWSFVYYLEKSQNTQFGFISSRKDRRGKIKILKNIYVEYIIKTMDVMMKTYILKSHPNIIPDTGEKN